MKPLRSRFTRDYHKNFYTTNSTTYGYGIDKLLTVSLVFGS